MDQTKGIHLTIVHCAIELSCNEDIEVKPKKNCRDNSSKNCSFIELQKISFILNFISQKNFNASRKQSVQESLLIILYIFYTIFTLQYLLR
jgi:hypothetical protein